MQFILIVLILFLSILFDFIDQLNFISFDNVDLISSNNQETFFDLYNRARQAGVVILS